MTCAARAASSIAAGDASRPNAMLARIVSLNSTTSWLTSAICSRRLRQLVLAHVVPVDANRALVRRRRSAAADSPASTCRCRTGRRSRASRPAATCRLDVLQRRRPCRPDRRTTRRSNSMSPRTRSAASAPPGGSAGSSSSSKMLWPAAMPCCSGPATPTRLRNGCAMLTSATRNASRSPMRAALVASLGRSRSTARTAEPSAITICTTGFDRPLVSTRRMYERRLCSLTVSNCAF